MDSPFKVLTSAFQDQYRVNFSLEGMDGHIVLTLSTDAGVAAKHLIHSEQLQTNGALQNVIRSIRQELAHTARPRLTGASRSGMSAAS